MSNLRATPEMLREFRKSAALAVANVRIMSMMIFQSCVRYCWVMRLQVSPVGLASPKLHGRPSGNQDFTAAMDAVNVDLDEMRVSG